MPIADASGKIYIEFMSPASIWVKVLQNTAYSAHDRSTDCFQVATNEYSNVSKPRGSASRANPSKVISTIAGPVAKATNTKP